MIKPITHEQVARATEEFLASGGQIQHLPDTTEEQAQVMRLEQKLEAGDGLIL